MFLALEYKLFPGPAFVDKRGSITNVLEAPIEHVAFITSRRRSVRANHYHRQETQYIYLLRGLFEATSRDVSVINGKIGHLVVEPNELLVTPPWVAHKHVYLKDSWFVVMNTAPRLQLEQKDTFKFEV